MIRIAYSLDLQPTASRPITAAAAEVGWSLNYQRRRADNAAPPAATARRSDEGSGVETPGTV